MSTETFLSACISVDYRGKRGVLREAKLQIRGGEVLGLVGQSGSGTIALAIIRLLDLKGGRVRGSVLLQGRDLMQLREGEMRRVRGREIGLVLQTPLSSLNPAMRIGRQLSEAWHAHAAGKTEDCRFAICEALHSVSLPSASDDPFLRRYPAQLSVGQAQRLLIAIAIIHRPALLIADEPTSALDVVTQAEILALFRQLNRTRGVSILYISHDLVSVASICDRVAILHEGEIVECATTEQIFHRPAHPYTKMLIAAQPGFVFEKSGTGMPEAGHSTTPPQQVVITATM